MAAERRWRYGRIAGIWSTALLAAVPVVLGAAALVQAGTDEGVDGRWLAVTLVGTVATGVVGYLLMGGVAAPSSRLDLAEPAGRGVAGEATAADWRRWRVICLAITLGGSVAMYLFLVALLGRGGLVEAAIAGVIAAVGLATRRDAARIAGIERDEGRRYYSVGTGPTGAARRLVWSSAAER